MIEYEKTEDPNVFKEIKTIERELFLDELQKKIDDLNLKIESIPGIKEKPDQETLDLWNAQGFDLDREFLEEEKEKKQLLLNNLKELETSG